MQINNNAVSRTQSRLVRSQKDTKRYIKIFLERGVRMTKRTSVNLEQMCRRYRLIQMGKSTL